MEIAIFMLAIVNVIGLVYLVSLQKNEQLASQKLVKAQMAELEKRNSEQMMQIWQGTMERLDHLSHSLNDDFDRLADLTEKRLFLINEKVSARLDSGFEKTSGAYQEMLERMARIDEAQKKLEGLQNEVVSLQNILGDKKTRGIFGEVQLNHLLENVFGKNDGIYQVQAKLPNGLVCDVLLKAPEPLGKIAIDSKFPLENYRRMVDRTLSDAQRQTASKQFKEDIKKHIQVYDYVAALQIAEEMGNINADFLNLLYAANSRMKLDLKNMKKFLNCVPVDLIPVKESNYQMLVEYALNLQIKLKKEEYADYVRALSPIMLDLYLLILKNECGIDILKDYSYRNKKGILRWDQEKLQGDQRVWQALRRGYQGQFDAGRAVENGHLRVLCRELIEDENIRSRVQVLSDVEEKVRNSAAHQLVSVTKSSIQNLTGESPEKMMGHIRFFVDRYIGKGRTGIWDSYDFMNQKLLEYL